MRYIFEITWIIWFLSEVLLTRIFRSKTKVSKGPDRNTLNFLWIAITIAITLGVLNSLFFEFPVAGAWINYTGLGLMLAGMLIRFIAIYTLGKFFTVDVSIHDNHHLVTNGLYRYIRHPAYTGSLMTFTGFGLSMNNWVSLIIVVVPLLLTFLYRIKVEESTLLGQSGLEYSEYMKHTWRLLPWIY
ncbi:MAG TPA: isoprenylcysteine carboxylmethyltransferase family protein [Bacteroidales bacterium]|jgi:protein-S-isoprenylcysteine O-methyltransferase Ste14|nr:isoprenylcysteine carboxylmethyltransferase family protein [Bacteroidales bacterium]